MYTPAPQQYQVAEMPSAQPVPQSQDKPKAPAKSKAGGDVGAFIQQCISLCAYLKELETQSHLIHLNIECPDFISVHKFLGEQYEAHLKQFDALAEFIRSMDFYLPKCACELRDLAPQMQIVSSYEWKNMLSVYYKNLEELGMKAKKLEPVAQKIGAIDIANFLADLVGQGFKAAWFIKSILRAS
jgi:DNA-binding ferritin-like protein